MPKITSLKELYVEELKDLWSSNDQMAKALTKITPQAKNVKLVTMLQETQKGITKHTGLLKSLIEKHDDQVEKEHCKGMEGLCKEAIKHTIEDAPEDGPVLDAAIISQYQRMTHYGITGFGKAMAFAQALKLNEDATKLESAVKEMYNSDELMTELAESAVNVSAATKS